MKISIPLIYSPYKLRNKMTWPFKDYDFIGDRYINIKSTTSECGEIMWYERDIDKDNTPTECLICIEAENEMYTKYAHPKAHALATAQASINAELLAKREKYTEEYIDYYIFYYGKEYKKIYNELYKKYKEEYSNIVLCKSYKNEGKICHYHLESLQYYHESR